MVETYWGLTGSPFRSPPSSRFIFRGEAFDEAHARLQFLIDQRRQLGILWGEAGVGKSLLLQHLADQQRRLGRCVTVLAPLAMADRDFLWEMASRFGLQPPTQLPVAELWHRILVALAVEQRLGLHRLLIVDDIDQVDSTIAPVLVRLLQQDAPNASSVTLLLAGNPRHRPTCDERLLERSELRVELGPWTFEETLAFVEESLRRAGARVEIFEPSAIDRLHEVTRGIPRQVVQLADWALLAGAGQQLTVIDAFTIDAVRDELCPLQFAH